MFSSVAFSVLLLCLVTGYAHGWAPRWEEEPMEDMKEKELPDEMPMVEHMYKGMEIEDFVHFLWKAVKHGDLCEDDAWALIEHYKYLKHCGMKMEKVKGMMKGMMDKEMAEEPMAWSEEEEEEEEVEEECNMEKAAHVEAEAKTGMEMDHMKALKMLSNVLMKDGASEHYKHQEWAKMLEHILFANENRQDTLIDMSQECTMKIGAMFWAPKEEIHLCNVKYTLPEVHEKVALDGEELFSAQNRHAPEVHITDLHGEPIHDGLYTMIWVDRAPGYDDLGSFDIPFLVWMVTNIPGCDVSKGDTVKCYQPSGMTENMQVFVYEQNDHIHDDFAIGDYTESDICRYQHRCHFQQAAFVRDYHLHQRALGHIVIHPDPYTSHLAQIGGSWKAQDACSFYLDHTLPGIFEYHKVDTMSKMAIKKAFMKYTSFYICHEALEDKRTMYMLKKQYGSLVNTLVHKLPTNDVLIPNDVEFQYDIGLKFHAEEDSVGLCHVWFDLPKVNRKKWLHNWEDGERVEFSSSEIRNAPMVKIVPKEHLMNAPPGERMDIKDKLFTLIIADRADIGEEFAFVETPSTPYINWMVVNIKGCDIESGHVIVPYLPWPQSTNQYVFLYEQHYEVFDIQMYQYTTTECRAENRCGFQQARFAWDLGLCLVGAGRYDIHQDIYGYTYQMRRGNETPNQACDAYLEAKKAEKAGEDKPEDVNM